MATPSKIFEAVEAQYLDPIIRPKKRLYRYNNFGSRYYFEFPDDEPSISYISVTSLSGLVIKFGIGYYNWLMDKGRDAMREKYEKMVYGTLFHVEAVKPIKGTDEIHGKGYDFDWLDEICQGHWYIDEDGKTWPATNFHMMLPPDLRHKADSWRFKFKKSLVSWFNFLKERVIQIFAVEYPLASRAKRLAGTGDLFCTMEFYNKVRGCYVDIKSFLFDDDDLDSRKNYFPHHEFQAEVMKDLWNEAHSDILEVTHMFNWSPKNYSKGPDDWGEKYSPYTLKNQTNNQYAESKAFNGIQMKGADILIAFAHVMGYINPPSSVSDITGKFLDIKEFDARNHAVEFEIGKK